MDHLYRALILYKKHAKYEDFQWYWCIKLRELPSNTVVFCRNSRFHVNHLNQSSTNRRRMHRKLWLPFSMIGRRNDIDIVLTGRRTVSGYFTEIWIRATETLVKNLRRNDKPCWNLFSPGNAWEHSVWLAKDALRKYL